MVPVVRDNLQASIKRCMGPAEPSARGSGLWSPPSVSERPVRIGTNGQECSICSVFSMFSAGTIGKRPSSAAWGLALAKVPKVLQVLLDQLSYWWSTSPCL